MIFLCPYWPGFRVKTVNMDNINVLAATSFGGNPIPPANNTFVLLQVCRFPFALVRSHTCHTGEVALSCRDPAGVDALCTPVCGDGEKTTVPSSSRRESCRSGEVSASISLE